MSDIEYRAAQVVDVSFPKRTIEMVVMPYESEATIYLDGKAVTEIVSRGAYDGVELRTSQIKVNRGHIIDDVVGKTIALHPSRQEGLVGEVRISETPRGEETLVLAGDGILDASAGFALMRKNGRTGPVVDGAEVWERRDRRRLNHLFLHHIALTPDPAYQDARVLDVRNAPVGPLEAVTGSSTPNLDRLQLDEWRAKLAALNSRWDV
jgi:phage head maturation protease